MIERVKIVEADTAVEFEDKINKCVLDTSGGLVKGIKFCMNPNIETGYAGTLVGDGAKYCAMIIYEGYLFE